MESKHPSYAYRVRMNAADACDHFDRNTKFSRSEWSVSCPNKEQIETLLAKKVGMLFRLEADREAGEKVTLKILSETPEGYRVQVIETSLVEKLRLSDTCIPETEYPHGDFVFYLDSSE